MNIVVITGMSGAGKSVAADILEDMGYYCIDNMPIELIPNIVSLSKNKGTNRTDIAFVADMRGETDFDALYSELDALKKEGCVCTVLFMDASNEVLLNRYKETRRIHPMSRANEALPLLRAIEEERRLLSGAADRADYVIDTTSSSVSQLREQIGAIYEDRKGGFAVNCMSFGFKYGAPADADMIFDLRSLPNPYYVESLRGLTGLDAPVSDYVFSSEIANEYYNRIEDMVRFLIPTFHGDGRRRFTVAFGCTGGKHRSVAFASRLREALARDGVHVSLVNRDVVKKFIGDK